LDYKNYTNRVRLSTYLYDVSICRTPVCNACRTSIPFHRRQLKLDGIYYWRHCVC